MDHCLHKVEGVAYLTNQKGRRRNGPLPFLIKKERRGRRVQPRPLEGGGDDPLSQSKLGGEVDHRVEEVVHLAIQKERGGGWKGYNLARQGDTT